MRIICIRPLKRDPNNTDKWSVLKGLKEEEFYYLYDGYDIMKDYIYLRDRTVPDDLYYPKRYAAGETEAEFKVDICAIVGENGSGKTTLAKFIGEELIPNRNNPREKYIVIFKQKRKLQYQYNLNNKLVDSDNRKISKNKSFIPSQVVYYSPFLTSEHPLVSRYVFDLSTT